MCPLGRRLVMHSSLGKLGCRPLVASWWLPRKRRPRARRRSRGCSSDRHGTLASHLVYLHVLLLCIVARRVTGGHSTAAPVFGVRRLAESECVYRVRSRVLRA